MAEAGVKLIRGKCVKARGEERRGRLSWNVAANFAGGAYQAVANILAIPVYIRLMGTEAFGLVGFYASLQAVLSILDFGLSPTMSREMARISREPDGVQETRDLVRTLETGYWIIGFAIGGAIAALSSTVADHWLKLVAMDRSTARVALMLIGAVAALQWPVTFYAGGLQGLERQIDLNLIRAAWVTVSCGGAVLVLMYVSSSVLAFFSWQIAASAVQTGLLTAVFWRCLPRGNRRAVFRPALARGVMSFAGGMTAITGCAIVLTQGDKLILSALVPLNTFACYTVAWTVANGPTLISIPFLNAIFPRLARLIAEDRTAELRMVFHQGAQVFSVGLIPLYLALIVFIQPLLEFWLRDPAVVERSSLIAKIVVAGSALNCLAAMPYTLQVAQGWTDLTLYTNLAMSAVAMPIYVVVARRWGVIGVACVWPAINIVYLLVREPMMFLRMGTGDAFDWYLYDVGIPVAAAGGSLVLLSWLLGGRHGAGILVPAAAGILSVGVAALATPYTRRKLITSIAPARFVGAA